MADSGFTLWPTLLHFLRKTSNSNELSFKMSTITVHTTLTLNLNTFQSLQSNRCGDDYQARLELRNFLQPRTTPQSMNFNDSIIN